MINTISMQTLQIDVTIEYMDSTELYGSHKWTRFSADIDSNDSVISNQRILDFILFFS